MKIASTVELSSEQIASYHEQGFLVLPAITTPEELSLLARIFADLFARRTGRAEGAQFDMVGHDKDEEAPVLPQIINPVDYAPGLRHTQFRANALAIARQLLGPTVTPAFEHAILKPAERGAETPWHQDEAFRIDADFEYQQLSIWMPLQDVTLENGCMEYIPGSHKGEVRPHRSPGDDPKVHALECAEGVEASAAVACPGPAGGATLHAGRTLHHAGPNRTGRPRGAYVLGFETPPKRCAPRNFYWNGDKQTAALRRRRAWRRRGGILVQAARKARRLGWCGPARLLFEVRRAFRVLCSLGRSSAT